MADIKKLAEFEVSAEAEESKTTIKMSVTKATGEDIKSIPSIGGDADIATYFQTVPGVVTTGDQGGQMYVRGGSPIQNKVLLDGMTIYNPFHSTVEKTLEEAERASGERHLGTDPKSGKDIIVRIGRFGPMAQIGKQEEGSDEKPRFASLRKNQSIATISLEDALELFKLPRTLGEFEGKVVKANIGRFGPYIQHDGKFASLKEEEGHPMSIELDKAIELVLRKREEDAAKIIKLFPEDDSFQLLNGRWGPYLKIGKKNFKLPKDCEPEKLTLEECVHISENQPTKKRAPRKKKK
mgnify:CR=1 FL=1